MSDAVVRIGLLGCGTISQFVHLPVLMRARSIHFTAICEGAPDLLQAMGLKTGVGALFTDYADFLKRADVDAVLIAVPDEFHLTLTKQALEAGKHVLVEKPLAATGEECAELVETVRRTGRKLQVGCMKRHDPGIAFARDFIRDRVGDISSASGWYRDSLFRYDVQEAILPRIVTSAQAIRPSLDPKTSDRRHYSLVTHGVHLFDTLRFLSGDIMSTTVSYIERHKQHHWHGLLEYETGAVGTFELSVKMSGDYHEGYFVQGEHGSVEIRTFLPFYNRPSEVRAFDGRTRQWHTPLGTNSNAYKNQIEAFARSILDDRPVNPDAVDGWAAVAILEAVEQSVKSGCRTDISSMAVKM